MKKIFLYSVFIILLSSLNINAQHDVHKAEKVSPEEAIKILKEGNERFLTGDMNHAHLDKERILLAGKEDQGNHAYATVITCSDSRVPVEAIFDAGIMDIFVIRVAGNVCDTDEIGSIEYGLAHVNTPVLVVLGHTQCGAVTAVTYEVEGHGHKLEANIPALVDNIIPAVKNAKKTNPGIEGAEIIPIAIKENVWQSIRDLFLKSPATRRLVKEGKVLVAGAIYNVGTGEIEWLPEETSTYLLNEAENNPSKIVKEFGE
jgi:carbonic anhydrase